MVLPLVTKHENLLYAALGDLIRRPVRSVIATLSLTAIMFPTMTALAISEGLRFQVRISVEEGADVYVSRDQYGANGPIATDDVQKLSGLEGVLKAVPRVVGRTYFVDRVVAVVGLANEFLPELKPLILGGLPEARGEVLVGRGIADKFGVKAGMPFTLAANNRKVFKTKGILTPSCLWGANLLVMHIDEANEFFRVKGHATQILLHTTSKEKHLLSESIARLGEHTSSHAPPFRIEDRRGGLEKLLSAYSRRAGIFNVLFVIGVALAVPAFLMTSGTGLREFRREVGVMKAIGWKTRDVIEKAAFENLALSLAATCLAVLLSMAWMKGLNGVLIAQFYISEVGLIPEVEIPSRMLPIHSLLCLAFALCVTQIGGLLSVLTKVLGPPSELMR